VGVTPRVSIRVAGSGYIVECLNREFACATIDEGLEQIRQLMDEPVYQAGKITRIWENGGWITLDSQSKV
jgi:hypothetical protein